MILSEVRIAHKFYFVSYIAVSGYHLRSAFNDRNSVFTNFRLYICEFNCGETPRMQCQCAAKLAETSRVIA